MASLMDYWETATISKTLELSLAAIPPIATTVAVMAGAGKVVLWLRDNWKQSSWNEDLREFRQESYTRFSRINGVILLTGAIATAMAVLKQIGTEAIMVSIGGIWLGLGGIVLLNYLLVIKMATYDGSDLNRARA